MGVGGTSRTKDDDVGRLVQEGIDSGEGLDFEDVFARLRLRIGHLAGLVSWVDDETLRGTSKVRPKVG